MPTSRPLISFDYAVKNKLRQKSNYDILEGFLTELLKQEIIIKNIPESESNQDSENDKKNVVDILCENDKGELIAIELQYQSEWDYLHRMLFGTSKIITNYLKMGQSYGSIRKVYSINIVYFNLGEGLDYIYHGITAFCGIFRNDNLQLNAAQKVKTQNDEIFEIFPEYYIIKVNNFDGNVGNGIGQWVYYFKNNDVPANYTAKGLNKVAEQLKIDNMTTQERIKYEDFLKNSAISESMLETALIEGELRGEAKKTRILAGNFIVDGFSNEFILKYTGLSIEEIEAIRKEMN